MSIGCTTQALLALLLVSSPYAHSGDVIEGIAATVNGHAILTSDVDQAVEYQCLLTEGPCAVSSAPARAAALQRLIEQALVQEQMGRGTLASNDREVAEKVMELRQSLRTTEDNDAEWSQLLGKYGLTEGDIAQQVQREIELRRYIDGRFRAAAHIERDAIQEYYAQTLLPQLQKAGTPAPSLASVEAKIREILIQQEIDQQFSSWLDALRQSSKIEVR